MVVNGQEGYFKDQIHGLAPHLYYNLSKLKKKKRLNSFIFDSRLKVEVSNESSWATDSENMGAKCP